ncbi:MULTISPECIES: Sec-independent protein translocase subunit TatA [Antrihabitans]|uniref:Sec-independent protein translocase protein TatA n=2 Tax=Antrihabitans TaxID=2799491 RepID=A0A934U0N8_9NOCA|nr:Sec-independent protein translocase subunit TatA [Antrihabitans stalagmiti]MBJ8337636.1 Sec-independent protein translocase subunit TatA [Antrihabitans stalagmiti]
MTGGLSAWHWVIVAIVVVILFGSKRLPDAARGLGRSLRIFKSEVKEMQSESKDQSAQADPTPAPAPTELPPVAPPQQYTASERSDPRSA